METFEKFVKGALLTADQALLRDLQRAWSVDDDCHNERVAVLGTSHRGGKAVFRGGHDVLIICTNNKQDCFKCDDKATSSDS